MMSNYKLNSLREKLLKYIIYYIDLQAGINVRPFAKEILEELSKEFEIIIFTASHSCYAKAVLEYLDP